MARPRLHIVPRDDGAPADYERFTFEPSPPRLTFGERLVAWGRRHGETATFHFALFAIAAVVGALAAAYMGVGR